MKKRRKRRKNFDWIEEISKGNVNKFYNSTDFDIWKEQVMERDNYECQFFAGKWDDGKHKPKKIIPKRAILPHHIIPIRERPDLALEVSNGVALSYEAHEIIHDRVHRFKKKERITSEKW